jgi:CRP-like cAMP-binding protein
MPSRRKTPIQEDNIEPHMCSVDVRLDILRQVPFFRALDRADIREINSKFHEQGFSAEEVIYLAGDPAGKMFVVADGKVKLMQHTLLGKDVMFDVLIQGDFFGSFALLGDDEYPETAIAQTQCCVLSIGSAEFRVLLGEFPAVSINVIDIMSERLRSAQEMIRQLSAFSVEQRIAHVLLKLAEKLGEQGEPGLLIQLPLSRSDLAEMVGTTTETASRVMSRFQNDGLIQSGRRWVSITDVAGLTARTTD